MKTAPLLIEWAQESFPWADLVWPESDSAIFVDFTVSSTLWHSYEWSSYNCEIAFRIGNFEKEPWSVEAYIYGDFRSHYRKNGMKARIWDNKWDLRDPSSLDNMAKWVEKRRTEMKALAAKKWRSTNNRRRNEVRSV